MLITDLWCSKISRYARIHRSGLVSRSNCCIPFFKRFPVSSEFRGEVINVLYENLFQENVFFIICVHVNKIRSFLRIKGFNFDNNSTCVFQL